MCVLRRLDAVLEPTKKDVLDVKQMLDQAGITEQRAALCDASRQAFYNTSKFTLRDLRARGSQQQLRLDFENYLDGFSLNVQDILENFKFRNQIPTSPRPTPLGPDREVPRPGDQFRPLSHPQRRRFGKTTGHG